MPLAGRVEQLSLCLAVALGGAAYRSGFDQVMTSRVVAELMELELDRLDRGEPRDERRRGTRLRRRVDEPEQLRRTSAAVLLCRGQQVRRHHLAQLRDPLRAERERVRLLVAEQHGEAEQQLCRLGDLELDAE